MEPQLENVSNEIINASAPTSDLISEKSKNSKGLIITTVIFAILAIAGIAGVVYFFMDASRKATQISDLQSKLDLIKTETGAEFVGDNLVTTELSESDDQEVKTLVKQIYNSLNENIPNGRFETIFGDGSIIKIPNSDTYTSSDKSYGVTSWGTFYDSSAGDNIMMTAHTYAEAILTSNGFAEDRELMSSKLFYNPNTNIYCDVSEQSLPFTLTCSKDSWISQESADLALSLAKAADTFYVSADLSRIKKNIAPYETLTANGLGAALLFYRVSPDSDWQFFNAAQGILPCSYYTGDAAKAFAGDTCYNETTGQDSTVQPIEDPHY